MNRETLAKRLENLPHLYKELSKYQTWDRRELIALGVLSEEEGKEIKELEKIEELISDEIRRIEKDIPYPPLEYPKEYQDIISQLEKLRPYITQSKAIRDALYNLQHSEHLTLVNTGINVRASDILAIYHKTADPVGIEYSELSKRKDRLERQNSRVTKLRIARSDLHSASVKEAEEQRQAELNSQYAIPLRRKEQLDRLIESRRRAKILPILEQIKGLLEAAAQANGKV